MDPFQEFLVRARRLSNRSDDGRLQLMLLLVETENQTNIWGSVYKTWYDMLRGEGLCTVPRYLALKRTLDIMPSKDIKLLGVNAAISIARISDPKKRNAVKKKTIAWIRNTKIRPTYQRISEYLKPKISKEKATGRFDYKKLCQEQQNQILGLRGKLKQQHVYIRLLKTNLIVNNIPVPKRPE